MQLDNTTINYYGVIESDEYDLINIAVVIVGVLSVSGTIGNALVIYAFSRQKLKKISTIFIFTLACTDFVTSLVTMPYTIVIELLHYKVEYDFVCKIYQFLLTSTVPFSAFLMVAIAFDRYLCIVHPLKHMTSMTVKRIEVIVALLFLLAVTLGLLCCLMYGTYSREVTCVKTNFTINRSASNQPSRHGKVSQQVHCNASLEEVSIIIVSTGYCDADNIIFDLPVRTVVQKIYCAIYAVCAVVVIVCYAILYHTVLIRRRQHIKTAVVLSIVAVTYIVAFMPAWLMILQVLTPNVIIFYLYFTYNVANPVIYAFLDEKFRKQLRSLAPCSRESTRDLELKQRATQDNNPKRKVNVNATLDTTIHISA